MSASSAAELIERLGGLYVRLIIPKEADRNTIRSEAEAHDVGFREVEGEFYVRASVVTKFPDGHHVIGNWTSALKRHHVRPDITKQHLFYDPSVRTLNFEGIDGVLNQLGEADLLIQSQHLASLKTPTSNLLSL
jgi:hypothetical protein